MNQGWSRVLPNSWANSSLPKRIRAASTAAPARITESAAASSSAVSL